MNKIDTTQHGEIERIQPKPWQLECLFLNPKRVKWTSFGKGVFTQEPLTYNTFSDFMKVWGNFIDDANELYSHCFEVDRPSEFCDHCVGSKLHEDFEQELQNHPHGRYKLTQEELEFMVKNGKIITPSHGRVYWDEEKKEYYNFLFNKRVAYDNVRLPALAEVNHDINKPATEHKWTSPLDKVTWLNILYTRRVLAGKPIYCYVCDGYGKVYNKNADPVLSLKLWIIKPEEAESVGVIINEIKRNELPDVCSYIQRSFDILRRRLEDFKRHAEIGLGDIETVSGSWENYIQPSPYVRPTHTQLFSFDSV